MSKTSSSGKPVFADAQRDARDDIFRDLLFPVAFGGATDPGTEAGINRGREGLTEQLAGQGLTGSGLAAKASSDFEQGAQQDREAQRNAVIERILMPLGNSSNSSGFSLAGSM